jgi:transcriptional regulator with XRE-family HTH domain
VGQKMITRSYHCQDLSAQSNAHVGTGGELYDRNIIDFLRHRLIPFVEMSLIENEIDLNSPVEYLAFIRETFEISLTDLAKMFGITRPTVYAWLNGQEPSAKDFARIQYFSGIAKEMKRFKIERVDVLIHRPIFSNKSFFDLITNSSSLEQWKTPLETLKKIADKESLRRKEQKGTNKELRSTKDINDDHSTPIF